MSEEIENLLLPIKVVSTLLASDALLPFLPLHPSADGFSSLTCDKCPSICFVSESQIKEGRQKLSDSAETF